MLYKVKAGEKHITLNEKSVVDAVLQNVGLILATPKGTVPLYRDFGIDFTVIDRPMNIAKKLLLRSAIKEAIDKYEPRAKIVNITFEGDNSDTGRMIPTVEIEIDEEALQ